MEEWGIAEQEQKVLPISTYLIGYVFGPMICAFMFLNHVAPTTPRLLRSQARADYWAKGVLSASTLEGKVSR